jgi:MoxR-like ATPase
MLQERVMTIGGLEIEFGIDTVFITTMNPEEHAGVYRISEALRDRLEKVKITSPSPQEELQIIDAYGKRLGAEVPDQLERKMVDITQRTRTDKAVNQPASVRATLAMYELTQSYALLRGDKKATVDDARDAAEVALQGRVLISPDSPHYDAPARYFREIIDYALGTS